MVHPIGPDWIPVDRKPAPSPKIKPFAAKAWLKARSGLLSSLLSGFVSIRPDGSLLRLLCLFAVLPLAAQITGNPNAQILSLDGPWQIVFDRQNEGRASGWYVQETFEARKDKRSITVPSCWETIEQDYEGAAWYGRHVVIPPGWKERVVRLQFGAVNYRAEVWVNGQPAGFHEGGYTPFELNVADLLRAGEDNFIAVRVLGPVLTKDTYLDGIGPNETPHWRGAIAGGIWQPVRLKATSRVYLEDLFVKPDIHNKLAAVQVTVSSREAVPRPVTVELAVEGEPKPLRRGAVLSPGSNVMELEFPIAAPRLWHPDQPHLYTARVSVTAGAELLDEDERRFGMREFVLRGDSYYLNGKKTFIKAGFWEGFYPDTLAFPADEAIVRQEIRLAKEAGFNVLRPWRKPPVPMILDIADEMGIMIVGAPPIECMDFWPQLVPETRNRIAIEIREMVLRDRNHPSLIYWELFNEIVRPGLARTKQEMSLLARDLDPTRAIIDESGGWAGGARLFPPYSYEGEPINEIHSYLPAPVDQRTYDRYLKLGRAGATSQTIGRSQIAAPNGLFFVSEFGYGGLPDLPANLARYKASGNPLTPDYRFTEKLVESLEDARRELKWDELFTNVSELCQASQRVQAEGNRLQMEALRLNPRLGGYCLHAYTDGDWVVGAGVLDLFRNKKLTFETVKRVQAPVYLAIQVEPSNLREGQRGRLVIQAVNEQATAGGHLEWELADPDGRVVIREQANREVPGGISTVLDVPVPPLRGSGSYAVRVRFQTSDGTQYQNQHEFFYLTKRDLVAPHDSVAVFDPENIITPVLKARGIAATEFPGQAKTPVFVATDTAKSTEAFRRYIELLDYVERGGVAVFLRPPARQVRRGKVVTNIAENPILRSGLFPLRIELEDAQGNWIPVNHGVRRHPIFEGLPSNDFMGQAYSNVCARETMRGIMAAPIVGSLSLHLSWENVERNYLGLTEAWWGADLVEIPHGKGRMLLSTLRLIDNLETDPVAERLLYNLVRWAASVSGPVEPAGTGLQSKFERFKYE